MYRGIHIEHVIILVSCRPSLCKADLYHPSRRDEVCKTRDGDKMYVDVTDTEDLGPSL